MKVLMFSLDPSILDPESKAGRRMADYGRLVDRLTIVLFSSGGSVRVWGDVTIYPTSRNKAISFFKGFWLGYRILRGERYDLITVHDFAPPLAGYPLARLFRIPLQFQVHSTFMSPYWKESVKNAVYQMLARFFVRRATCVRTVSERIQDSLVEELDAPAETITVLPIYTDAGRIASARPKFDLHEKYPHLDFIVLAASRLVKQKNVSLLISSMKDIIRRHPSAGLVIVGRGPHQAHLKRESADMPRNIMFEPWTDDLPSYYKTADLFVLTSNYEGWALTVIEAMAAGTAVVMTDVGCAGEVVKDGSNGVVIPIGDKVSLTRAVELLCQNPTERKRLAKAGQETVLNLKPRTWEEYLARYRKDWENCIKAYEHH